MDTKSSLTENFKSELEKVTSNTILDPKFKKKKLLLWAIRTMITIILYVIFWKYDWIKWTLMFSIPLSLFSLFTIIALPYFLNRKINLTKKKIVENESKGIIIGNL